MSNYPAYIRGLQQAQAAMQRRLSIGKSIHNASNFELDIFIDQTDLHCCLMLLLDLHKDVPESSNYQQVSSIVIATAIINLHVNSPLKHKHWPEETACDCDSKQ